MIRLTRRGFYAISMTLALAILAALSRDIFISIAASTLTAALTLEASFLFYRLRRRCRLEARDHDLRLLLGEERVVEATITCRGSRVEFNSNIVGAELRDDRVLLRFRGLHTGFYDISGGRLWVSGSLGLLEAPLRLDFSFRVRVIPRVVYALLEALEALRGAGVGVWEFQVLLAGRRGEYIYTREYVPGDELKTIDWKATARSLKLMVKTFSREEGSGVGGLYIDVRCFGEHSCDNLATSLLTVALASRSLGGRIKVYDASSRETLDLDPTGLIAYSLSKVLEPEVADKLSIYEFIEPLTHSEIARLLKIHLKDLKQTKDPWIFDVKGLLIAVSSTLVNVEDLLKVAETLGGDNVTLITHHKPWLDARDLEDAYVIHETHERVCGKLRGVGVKIIYCCPLYFEEVGAGA
ncbi:MAG: DUF58 domain-containing protein [Sulfolobales archaeon]